VSRVSSSSDSSESSDEEDFATSRPPIQEDRLDRLVHIMTEDPRPAAWPLLRRGKSSPVMELVANPVYLYLVLGALGCGLWVGDFGLGRDDVHSVYFYTDF